jgi:hypothetical protein
MTTIVPAVGIGLAVGGFVYAALAKAPFGRSQNRAVAVGSFGLGGVVSWWLMENPDLMLDAVGTIAGKAVGLLVVVVVAASLFWKFRGWR